MHTWKISQRLMAGFGLVIVALLGMSIYSMLIARGIDGALTANATQNAVIQRAAINFRGSAHDRSIAVRDVVLAPSEDARKKEVESIARLADFYAKSATQLDAVLQTATQVPPEVGPMVQALKDIEARTVATTAKVVALVQSGDRTGAEALLWAEAKPQYEQWLAAANKLIDYEEARIIKNSATANQDRHGHCVAQHWPRVGRRAQRSARRGAGHTAGRPDGARARQGGRHRQRDGGRARHAAAVS